MAQNPLTALLSLENARDVALSVRSVFPHSALDDAVREAMEAQMEPGRIHVFIPCNTNREPPGFPPSHFQEMLYDPTSHKSAQGEPKDKARIFGKADEAFTATHATSGEPYPGFLVYDSAAAVIVDMIGRDGKSILNPMFRQSYLEVLENELGYSVARQEQPLVADPARVSGGMELT